MAELTVDLTYGSALFQAAAEVGKKDQILEEGKQVLSILEQEPKLNTLFNFPAISAQEKKTVLTEIFEGRICRELLNLLFVLVDKGRTGHFSRIMKTYQDMLNKEDGYAYGTIYSVEPLTEEQLAKFESQTSTLMKNKTRLENKLDKALIGGVKILVDGRIIDASLRKRLTDLHKEII